MAKIVYDIKPRMADSAYIEAPFDEGKKMLEEVDYRVISAEENARLRIREGKDADICKNGNWTREGPVYVPNEAHVYLTKLSPIMENPAEATKAHKDRKEFYPTDEQIARATDASVSIKVPYNQNPIPTDRFGENEIALFAFGENAEQYGNFLKESEISEMLVYLVDKSNVDANTQSFARQLWLRRLDDRSLLDGYFMNLYYDDRVRGVPSQAAEGSAATREKLDSGVKLYTSEDISRTLSELNLSGIESLIMQKLAQ